MLLLNQFLFFALTAWTSESLDTLRVESRPLSTKKQCLNVTGGDVRLGDLAVFYHSDKNVLERIINLKTNFTLSELNQIQNGAIIERISEVLRLEKETSLKSTGIVFELVENINFTDCDTVNENYLYNLAQISVLTKCVNCQVQSITNLAHIRLKSRPTEAVLGGRDNAQVTFVQVRTDQSNRMSLFHDVFISTQVLVTQVNLKKGQVLDSSLVVKQKKTLPFRLLHYLPPIDIDLTLYQLISGQISGHVLRIADMKKRDVVSIGQVLKGRIHGHHFEVESTVMAKRSGAIGEIIPVQSMNGNKIFSARIKSAEEVELLE